MDQRYDDGSEIVMPAHDAQELRDAAHEAMIRLPEDDPARGELARRLHPLEVALTDNEMAIERG